MLETLLTIGMVSLLVSNRSLKARINRIEATMLALTTHHGLSGAISKDRQAGSEPEGTPPPVSAPLAARPLSRQGGDGIAQDLGAEMPHGPGLAQKAVVWLQHYWVYAISALSLALAGIFAGQYAADQGYLDPSVRVALAAMLGLALIAGGEVIRRRIGDGVDVSTAYLPSIFSGAGIVTLYGSVLSAQYLYDMIGPMVALVLLALIAVASVILGWFYGVALTAMGLLGATLAPFLVGGEPGAPGLLNAYFGAVTLAGLAVNALRKWRGIDALALFVPYAAAALVAWDMNGFLPFIAHSVLLAAAAGIIPGGSLTPRLVGAPVAARLMSKATAPADGRQRMLAAAWAATVAGITLAGSAGHQEMIAASLGLALLFSLGMRWARDGAGAIDLVAASTIGLFALSVLRDGSWPASDLNSSGMPSMLAGLPPLYALLAAGGLASALAARCSLAQTGQGGRLWACAAAVIGPGLLVGQELLWAPADAIGALTWAGIAMAFAIAGTLFVERAASIDPEDRLRVSLGAVVASSMIALALFVMLSQAALTAALGVLVLTCVGLDLRYRLPALGWFIQAGAAVMIYRAVADPGLAWALEVSAAQLAFGYGLPAVLLGAAWMAMERRDRPLDRAALEAALEGALVVTAGTGLSALIMRAAQQFGADYGVSHWSLGLMASVWLLAAGAALSSALTGQGRAGGLHQAARLLRLTSAGLAAALGAVAILLAVVPFNPLLSVGEPLWGVAGLSSLIPAYLLPGLVILGIAMAVPGMSGAGRKAGIIPAGLLVFLYACLSVAQAWRGNVLAAVPMGDGELWTYTALLIVSGAALLVAGILRRSRPLRHAANGMLILAIAKVFLVDAPDLEGLLRAGSFLILGLALAGLAWINRLASRT